jgi:hypothetical protein
MRRRVAPFALFLVDGSKHPRIHSSPIALQVHPFELQAQFQSLSMSGGIHAV